MNPTTSFARLTWKEYRIQRSLWWSVLLLTIIVQIAVVLGAGLLQKDSLSPNFHLALPFVAFGIYLLACGATLFAIEHEWATFDFQRTLPVSASQVCVTKLGLGLGSGLLLLFASYAISQAGFLRFDARLTFDQWLAGILVGGEIFAWSAFCSLLLRQPLRAALVAAVLATVWVGVLLPAYGVSRYGTDAMDEYFFYRSFAISRGIMLAGLLLLDLWLGLKWFSGTLRWPRFLRLESWRVERRQIDRYEPFFLANANYPSPYPARSSSQSIALWSIAWRQGRLMLVSLLGLYFVIYLVALANFDNALLGPSRWLVPITVVSAILFGLSTFTLDQGRQTYRYYAERGIDPHRLWWSRQVLWLVPVCLQTAGVLSLPFATRSSSLVFVLLMLALFAIGQFCAMFVRSTLVAATVSIFCSVLFALWTFAMEWLDVPLWWSAGPIPLVLLFATWWFVGDWVLDRGGWKHGTKLAGLVGIPLLLILLGCITFRVTQIPYVDPGFSLAEYTRPLNAAEQETLRLYTQAAQILRPHGEEAMALQRAAEDAANRSADWLAKVQPALPLLLQAHDRPPVPVTLVPEPVADVGPHPAYLGHYQGTAMLIFLQRQAEALTHQGELNAAWRHYEIAFELLRRIRWRATPEQLRYANHDEQQLLQSILQWAQHPEQTDDRIRVALSTLDGLSQNKDESARWQQSYYVLQTAYLQGEPIDPYSIGLTPQEARTFRRTLRLLPWERARTQRLLNFITRARLSGGTDSTLPVVSQSAMEHTIILANPHWLAVVPEPIQVWRDAVRIQIGLIAWRREHGELPETLEALVGDYFRAVPHNPVTQGPYVYSHRGLPIDLHAGGDADAQILLPNETPFLWTSLRPDTGPLPDPDLMEPVEFLDQHAKWAEIFRWGMHWRIPQPVPDE